MYNLTKRQEAILYYILNSKENITIKKLAAKYQLSERMIHYDIDYINAWIKEKGSALKKSKTNIYLEADAEHKKAILNELYKNDVTSMVLNKQERLEYIYNKLIFAGKAVTSESLVEDLMVSRATILSDLKDVEEKFQKVNLNMMSKKGTGYWISGKEIVIRTQIIETAIKVLMKSRVYNYNTLYSALFKENETQSTDYMLLCAYIKEIHVEPIFDMLNILRKENGILISDADSLVLFISIVVMVRQVIRGFTVKKENIVEIKRSEETRWFVLARGICEQLEDDYGISYSKIEITYMILTLIRCNVDFVKRDRGHRKIELEGTIDLMLQQLMDSEVIYIDNHYMQDLNDDLYEYLFSLIRKKKFKIATSNPLLVQTKAGYPVIFEEATRLAKVFEAREGIALTEEEIGVIAVHIAAYETNNQGKSEKTVIIVCNEGKGLSKALYNRIKNNIPNIKIKNIVSVYDINQNKELFDNVDFVISTVELQDLTLPVFCVSPIISRLDIRNIIDYASGNISIKVVDEHQEQDNYLEDVIIGIMAKYLDTSKLNMASSELNYFLKASTGFVTAQNAHLIEEEYAYKVSMVIVKLSDMFNKIVKVTHKNFEIDTLMGLTIHIVISVSRWENKDFYEEKGGALDEKSVEPIRPIVETFLDDVSEIFNYTVGRCEATAIMRYLL